MQYDTTLYLIKNALVNLNFPRILRVDTAKEAREVLQLEFQGDTKMLRSIKLQSLRSDFENFKMKKGELMKDYFSRVLEIVNQLKSYEKIYEMKKLLKNYC